MKYKKRNEFSEFNNIRWKIFNLVKIAFLFKIISYIISFLFHIDWSCTIYFYHLILYMKIFNGCDRKCRKFQNEGETNIYIARRMRKLNNIINFVKVYKITLRRDNIVEFDKNKLC